MPPKEVSQEDGACHTTHGHWGSAAVGEDREGTKQGAGPFPWFHGKEWVGLGEFRVGQLE